MDENRDDNDITEEELLGRLEVMRHSLEALKQQGTSRSPVETATIEALSLLGQLAAAHTRDVHVLRMRVEALERRFSER